MCNSRAERENRDFANWTHRYNKEEVDHISLFHRAYSFVGKGSRSL